MKQLGIFILLSAVFLSGCEKTITEENPLVGKWLWVKSAGGATGNHIITPSTPPPAGGYKLLWILDDAEFILDRAQDNFKRLRYTTSTITDIETGKQAQGILFYDEYETPGIQQIYRIEANQLIIKDNITEAYTHYYKKVID